AAAYARQTVATQSPVRRERAGLNRHAAAGDEQAAATGLREGPRLVDGQETVGQRQVAASHIDAAAISGQAVGNRQAGQGDGGAAGDCEDAVVSAAVPQHGQKVGPGALDVDVRAQVGQGAGQVDGAGDREGDDVVAGLGVGVQDCLAQRAGAAVK